MKVNFTKKAAVEQRRKYMKKGRIGKKGIIAISTIAVLAFAGTAYLISGYLSDVELQKQIRMIATIERETRDLVSEIDPESDTDNDGVLNGKETAINTSLDDKDTDGDGLSDGDELDFKTDPLISDTDGDGILDGYELFSGLDPLKTSTDGKTSDKERTFTITRKMNEATLTVTGNANVNASLISQLDLVGFSSNSGVLSSAYQIYTEYQFDSAEISFQVNFDKLKSKGIANSELAVFRFDSATKQYTELESTTDAKSGTVTASISQSGTYVLGRKNTITETGTTRILFLIDNSGSMYPKEMVAESQESDVDFKRLDFAESLIKKFDSSYEIGISKFTAQYTSLVDFTTDRDKLTNALESIRNGSEYFSGTYIEDSLESGMAAFNAEDGKYTNIIVLLTDGESTDPSPLSADTLVSLAEDDNIVVLTVGLGHDIDRDLLSEIADGTGGKYYSASDADALDNVYQQIVTTLNYELVESTGDAGTGTGYMLFNTGFLPQTNGFSFNNLRVSGGDSLTYGMAVFARDYYTGKLHLTMDGTPEKTKSTFAAASYNLQNTAVATAYAANKPLNSIYSVAGNRSDFLNCENYLEFDTNSTTINVKPDIYKKAYAEGWTSSAQLIQNKELPWTAVQFLHLDIQKSLQKIQNTYGADEAALFSALYRLNVLKYSDDTQEYNLANGDETFTKLIDELQQGIPSVVTLGGSHTVNVISMRQDVDVPNRFILTIYDSNYKNTTREVILTRNIRGVFENGNLVRTENTYSASYNDSQTAFVLIAQ